MSKLSQTNPSRRSHRQKHKIFRMSKISLMGLISPTAAVSLLLSGKLVVVLSLICCLWITPGYTFPAPVILLLVFELAASIGLVLFGALRHLLIRHPDPETWLNNFALIPRPDNLTTRRRLQLKIMIGSFLGILLDISVVFLICSVIAEVNLFIQPLSASPVSPIDSSASLTSSPHLLRLVEGSATLNLI